MLIFRYNPGLKRQTNQLARLQELQMRAKTNMSMGKKNMMLRWKLQHLINKCPNRTRKWRSRSSKTPNQASEGG